MSAALNRDRRCRSRPGGPRHRGRCDRRRGRSRANRSPCSGPSPGGPGTVRGEQRRQPDPPPPLGCSSAPGTLSAAFLMKAFSRSGVVDGYFWRMRAAAPDTIAADSDVPLPRWNRSPIRTRRANEIDVGPRHAQALDVGTWRHEVRVPTVATRTARGKGSDGGFPRRQRHWPRRRPRTGRRQVMRGPRHPCLFLIPGFPAAATTKMPCFHACRPRTRADRPGRPERVRAIGEVEDADVQAVVVFVLNDPVDGGDDLGDVGPAVGRRDLDAEDLGRPGRCRGRRDASRAAPEPASLAAISPAMNVPWPFVSMLGEIGSLGLERQVRPHDQLPRFVEAGDWRAARVDERHVNAVAREPGTPPVLCADALRDAVHGVRIGGGVIPGSASRRNEGALADDRRNEGHEQRDDSPPAVEAHAPAERQGRRSIGLPSRRLTGNS